MLSFQFKMFNTNNLRKNRTGIYRPNLLPPEGALY